MVDVDLFLGGAIVLGLHTLPSVLARCKALLQSVALLFFFKYYWPDDLH